MRLKTFGIISILFEKLVPPLKIPDSGYFKCYGSTTSLHLITNILYDYENQVLIFFVISRISSSS
jgi:hypothetical protein